MATDPTLDDWLDEWEVRHAANPSLTPDQFLQAHAGSVPDELHDELRAALIELIRMDGVLDQMKTLDRKVKHRERERDRKLPREESG